MATNSELKRCDTCNGYAGEPRKLKIGDKCEFVVETCNGRCTRLSVRVGKLAQVFGPDKYSVIYRKTLYSTDSISHPGDPSAISLAMFGRCTCDREAHHEE